MFAQFRIGLEKLKLAYLGGSHTGGTYRVFMNLRRGLSGIGVDLVLESAPEFPGADDDAGRLSAARAVVARLSSTDGVVANAFMSVPLMNVVRYLPPLLPRILVVHNITHATMQAARALRDHAHYTVGVSPRIRDDLVRRFGFDSGTTKCIFNAVDPDSVCDPLLPRPATRVLSLGRIEHASKGVLQLPKIFDHAAAECGNAYDSRRWPGQGKARGTL